jgi:hypothetical protein
MFGPSLLLSVGQKNVTTKLSGINLWWDYGTKTSFNQNFNYNTNNKIRKSHRFFTLLIDSPKAMYVQDYSKSRGS